MDLGLCQVFSFFYKMFLPTNIPGVSPSLHSNQLLTSTGTPHLDSLLGGGLPLGSLLLLQEDSGGSYGKLLVRYFLSEGLVHNHALVAV